MKIKDIWLEQESDPLFKSGIILRGFGGTVLPEIYIALKSPGKFRCIVVSINNAISINLDPYQILQDLEIELVADVKRINLIFKLVNPVHNDIFSILCEDLISSVTSISDDRQVIRELFNRFENWDTLFKKNWGERLSLEAQCGLYGELYFLREFLSFNKDWFNILNSWVGSEKQLRDFQAGSWAVEVKTTRGNNHQKVLINGERQLDNTNLENLYLYHLSLEVLQKSGETLPEIIASVCSLLETNVKSLNRFLSKLLFSGYREEDKHHYQDIGYFIRDGLFYKVEGDFPRIVEGDLRKGIGDIKYSIILSNCSNYITDSETVFNTIIFHD